MKRSIQIFMLLISVLLSTKLCAQNVISPYLDLQGPLYSRDNIYSLNKAANGWIPWAVRNTSLSETTINLTNILSLNANGSNVGVGTNSPLSILTIADNGAQLNSTNVPYTGGVSIQGNTGSRSFTSGAQLEFVIPANTDGSNLWGQGRIITVAGNSSSGNATGRMILGTRRYFDKGTGQGWNYGDDIVIDGTGNVGIGTLNPDAKLAVKGDIHTKEVRVDVVGSMVGDYVFEKDYNLISLPELENYLEQNKHLPEVPSAKEFEAEGMKLKEMNLLLLKKVEELTLYVIEQDKKIDKQQEVIQKQSDRLNKLENLK